MKKVNSLFATILRKAEAVVRPGSVYAHCDIPCGIYETSTMTTAADTVAKMVEKIMEIKGMELADRNNFVRIIVEKEEQAQLCKEQILILWTDYFKDEHLAKFPDLHTKVWKATKLCSQAKRTVDQNITKQLKDAVEEIARIFAETKK